MISKKSIAISLASLIVGVIVTLLAVLLPYWGTTLLLIFVLIISWVLYDRFFVDVMNWRYIWWSPHIKRVKINSQVKKNFEPEVAILTYFLENNFERYSRIPITKGFIITGKNKSKGKMFGRYKNNLLEVKFYPMISKRSVASMKDFEKFIRRIKFD